MAEHLSKNVPVEKVSYRRLFWVLALLNLIAAVWIVWDETKTRRPWKDYQARFNTLLAKRDQPTMPLHIRQVTNKALGIVDRCESCHLGIDRDGFDGEDIPKVFRAHPRRKELLGGNHPVKRFGCTVCHQGQGSQTKGIGHRDFDHGRNDPYWDQPMLSTVFAESSCVGCHRDEGKIMGADTFNRGRELFIGKRCFGCHDSDLVQPWFAAAPPLDYTAKKLSATFVAAWLRDPSAFRPQTAMPNFWPRPRAADGKFVSAGTDGYRAWQRQRDEEISAIVAYLGSTEANRPLPRVALPDLNDAALIKTGNKMFDTIGCRACHTTAEATSGPGGPASLPTKAGFGPSLARVGEKNSANWLAVWLKEPAVLAPRTRMPDLRVSPAERNALVAFLVSLRKPGAPAATPRWPKAESRLIDAGREAIQKYGCYGCHAIRGIEGAGKAGPDLNDFGDKTPDRLTWGGANPSCETPAMECWTMTKLQRPRWLGGARLQLVMPEHNLSQRDARALAVFVLANRVRNPPPRYQHKPSAKQRALDRGEGVIARMNCRACHEIGRAVKREVDDQGDVEVTYVPNGGDIRKHYKVAALAPPPLTFAGEKFQYEWLFNFLSRPSKIRPWLTARMPTFRLTDADKHDLIRYFAVRNDQPFPFGDMKLPQLTATARSEARALFTKFKCVSCHQSTPETSRAVSERAPDLAAAARRLRAAWIRRWLLDPQKMQPGTKMPSFFPLEDEDAPKGPRITPCPDCFDGDIIKQIAALTAVTLEQVPSAAPPTAPAKQPPAQTKQPPAQKKRPPAQK